MGLRQLFWGGRYVDAFDLLDQSADGRVVVLQQIERESKVQPRITWHRSKCSRTFDTRRARSHMDCLKKILSRETDLHQVKIHFRLHQKSHFILQFASFCCFSQRTAQLTANFARQDARISWYRFTKRKFNLISDRDAFLEIANGQQIPYNLVCL